MRTVETKLYCFAELSEDAKSRALGIARKRVESDPDCPAASECVDSLKAVADALGYRARDWSIGPYNRSPEFDIGEDYDDADAKPIDRVRRFLAVLVSHGYTKPVRMDRMKFPGVCGFTGVCFDEDVCETVWKSLREGHTFREAFDHAASRCCAICEDELEYQTSDEGILEMLDEKEERYTEDGNEF
jgi:hypothetical protein